MPGGRLFLRSNCKCLICGLEDRFGAEMQATSAQTAYHELSLHSAILSKFPTPLALIEQLHQNGDTHYGPSPDQILNELVHAGGGPNSNDLWQCMIVMVFIPTVHRTTTQIAFTFPNLPRDDIAQFVLSALFEYLASKELRSRHSHIAFAVARKLRRSAFRWAIRESRSAPVDESNGHRSMEVESSSFQDSSYSEILLRQFLDDCEQRGWLSPAERIIIYESKIEGRSCAELARRDGQSVIAVRHRLQRLIDRLRRLATDSEPADSPQMKLFRR
jgi:DNA-directed RNA polymerase specialized sigma24 family protein